MSRISKITLIALLIAFVGCHSQSHPQSINANTILTGEFNGKQVVYEASVTELVLVDASAVAKASVVTFNYLQQQPSDASPRPITFVWSGGPGSTSVILHLDAFGPKRVQFPLADSNPSFSFADNTDSLLDTTDLVFIDTIGTGFSTALGKYQDSDFWGLYEDAQLVAEAISVWLEQHQRQLSPLFIVGESYGTTRAAAVADILRINYEIDLQGILMLSQALDFQGSSSFVEHNIIANYTYLPTLAATALHYDRIEQKPESNQLFLEQVKTFATQEYMPALLQGSALPEQAFANVGDQLAYFTGLTKTQIELANLRIDSWAYAQLLFEDHQQQFDLLDSRIRYNSTNEEESAEVDSGELISYKMALHAYLQQIFQLKLQRDYIDPDEEEFAKNWRYRNVPEGELYEPAFVNTAHDLARAMDATPTLKLFVASGYYDLITPFFDAEYTLGRYNLDRSRIQLHNYHSGHLIHQDAVARSKLLEDIRGFILQNTMVEDE